MPFLYLISCFCAGMMEAVPPLIFQKRSSIVNELLLNMSLTSFFSSSLCSNGLDVLLNNRDYLWYKSFSVIVHREKYDAKGILYSGCQTQLPLAVTSTTCVTVAFPGPVLHRCIESSLCHPSHHRPLLLTDSFL